jgi:hypothetical protein
MTTRTESPIKEKDLYYVLCHKSTGLYVNARDSQLGSYDLEATSLLDYVENQVYFGPMRIYPCVDIGDVSALEIPPGAETDAARQIDQRARWLIDWLNQHEHYLDGTDTKYHYEYSDFQLVLVEVECTVRRAQPVTAIV